MSNLKHQYSQQYAEDEDDQEDVSNLKHQYSQQYAEDEDDQEDGKSNEEQNLGNNPETFGDSCETEETSNERNDEKDNGSLHHAASFTECMCLSALVRWL